MEAARRIKRWMNDTRWTSGAGEGSTGGSTPPFTVHMQQLEGTFIGVSQHGRTDKFWKASCRALGTRLWGYHLQTDGGRLMAHARAHIHTTAWTAGSTPRGDPRMFQHDTVATYEGHTNNNPKTRKDLSRRALGKPTPPPTFS